MRGAGGSRPKASMHRMGEWSDESVQQRLAAGGPWSLEASRMPWLQPGHRTKIHPHRTKASDGACFRLGNGAPTTLFEAMTSASDKLRACNPSPHPPPVALIHLVSYTSPASRDGFHEVFRLAAANRVPLVSVYTEEAHPSDGPWTLAANKAAGITVPSHADIGDRLRACSAMVRQMGHRYDGEWVVDTMSNSLGDAYEALPGRVYVIVSLLLLSVCPQLFALN